MPNPTGTKISFGIMTAQSHVSYADLLRVWQEADSIPELEHAWIFDHLFPITGDITGSNFEGWTLLSALAARTQRLRLGLMVTSNRFRPPAMLAKIAATVDHVSNGRLDFGIGAGSRPSVPMARLEYEAHGFGYHDADHAVASLGESLTVIRRLWSEPEPFDFGGEFITLKGAFGNPKPVQQPHPPILIGGQATPTLRLVAEHADIWSFNGGDYQRAVSRNALLDRLCAEIGRDPSTITRSTVIYVDFRDPAATQQQITDAIGAGFSHLVLSLTPPYPDGVAHRLADEVIRETLAQRA